MPVREASFTGIQLFSAGLAIEVSLDQDVHKSNENFTLKAFAMDVCRAAIGSYYDGSTGGGGPENYFDFDVPISPEGGFRCEHEAFL